MNFFNAYLTRAALFISCAALLACKQEAVSINTPAPSAVYKTITGEQINQASLKNKVTLVNFWATSCSTCVAEMPMLAQTYKQYNPQGYETIAVAMSYDRPDWVLNFAQTRALPFKVALDVDGAVEKAFGGVKATPTTFLIDKNGAIVKRYVGAPNEKELHALIEKLLKA